MGCREQPEQRPSEGSMPSVSGEQAAGAEQLEQREGGMKELEARLEIWGPFI